MAIILLHMMLFQVYHRDQFWVPHYFLICINGIVDGIQSTIRLFTDNCLIYRCISSPADQCILQEDLNRLSSWVATWQMNFNVSKCNIMWVCNASIGSGYRGARGAMAPVKFKASP